MALLTDPVQPPIPEKPSIRAATKTKTHPTNDGSVPETRGKSPQPSSLFPPPEKNQTENCFHQNHLIFSTHK